MKKITSKINFDILVFLAFFSLVFIFKAPIFNTPLHLDEIGFYSGVTKILGNKFNPFIEWWGYHPPLIYLLAAFYEHFFGFSRIALHLLIAASAFLTLWLTYLLGKHLYSQRVGFLAALLLFFCPLFFAQSGLFHLAIPLTALSIASLYFYLSNQKIKYLLTASIMVLTKETGMIIVAGIFLYQAYQSIKEKELPKQIIKKLNLVSFPGLVFLIWMILNKIFLGWFLWPEFFSKLPWPAGSFREKFYVTFLADWRWLIAVFVLGGSLKFFVKDRKNKILKSHYLLFLVLPLIVFFSLAWGVFLPRYILFVYPPWFICFMVLLEEMVKKKNHQLLVVLVIIFLFVSRWFPKEGEKVIWGGEMNMAYLDVVSTHRSALRFVEANFTGNRIQTTGLISLKLREPKYGYVKKGISALFPTNRTESPAKTILITSEYLNMFPDAQKLARLKDEENLLPLKVFSSGGETVSIYKLK